MLDEMLFDAMLLMLVMLTPPHDDQALAPDPHEAEPPATPQRRPEPEALALQIPINTVHVATHLTPPTPPHPTAHGRARS